MATYNGEKYLREQINSIISQSYNKWTLYIHDDGSTDNTLQIINEYVNKNNNIIFLPDTIANRGVYGSFLFLLKQINADYYMFADQDDIWLPDKIKISIHTIWQKTLVNKPMLAHCNIQPVDQNLNYIAPPVWDKIFKKKLNDLDHVVLHSLYTGCTMIINRALRRLIIHDDNPLGILHDQLIAIHNKINNGLFFHIYTPLILYRQHSNNTVGFIPVKNKFRNRLINFKKIIKNLNKQKKIAKYYFNVDSLTFTLKYLISKFNIYHE